MTAGTLTLGTSLLNRDTLTRRTTEAPSFILDWKETLKSSAIAIKLECSNPGWDGYDAYPISNSSLKNVIALIDMLPVEVSLPDIVPEPGGEIGLEWRDGQRKILSISASEENLIYAVILGRRKVHGEEPMNPYELPDDIKELLSHFYR